MDCNRFELCIESLEKNDIKESGCLSTDCLSSFDTRSKVVVEENKKKYELINDQHEKVGCFHVDGGMIKSKGSVKCDNLLIDINSKVAVFVELKGTDLKHALEQVDATMKSLSLGLAGYRTYARIVTSNRTNVPDIHACPQYIALNRKILRAKGNIKIHSKILSERISTL